MATAIKRRKITIQSNMKIYIINYNNNIEVKILNRFDELT